MADSLWWSCRPYRYPHDFTWKPVDTTEEPPGYTMLRDFAGQLTEFQKTEGFKPALVEIEEALVPAFIVEEHGERCTVFVPSVPAPMTGTLSTSSRGAASFEMRFGFNNRYEYGPKVHRHLSARQNSYSKQYRQQWFCTPVMAVWCAGSPAAKSWNVTTPIRGLPNTT